MRLHAVAVIALCSVALVEGQQGEPRYEIRSFRRNTTGDANNSFSTAPDRLVWTNLQLTSLILRAYTQGPPFAHLLNIPPWLAKDRYDVFITGPFGDPREKQQLALQALLAERLKLVAHSEIHAEPTFDLVLSRADGQLGSALKPSVCSGPMAVLSTETTTGGATRTVSRFPTPQEAMTRCGWWTQSGTLYSGGLSMKMLANMLEGPAGRRVVDRTGVEAFYSVRWAFAGERRATSPDTADLMFRLENDLGLRLVPSATDVEVVVIDHIERPTEN